MVHDKDVEMFPREKHYVWHVTNSCLLPEFPGTRYARGRYQPGEISMNSKIKTGLVVSAFAATLSAGVFIGQAFADQPHMQSALDALRTARSELQAAEANKGGHRVKALNYVNSAIDEVRAGIEFRRDH
jgi:hypothetical protein